MSNQNISEILAELKSEEIYTRNSAIKKVIKGKTNDKQIIVSLKEIIENDPYVDTRNFARTALDVLNVEHSGFEETKDKDLENIDQSQTQMNDSEKRAEYFGAILFGGIIGSVGFAYLGGRMSDSLFFLGIVFGIPIGAILGLIILGVSRKFKKDV